MNLTLEIILLIAVAFAIGAVLGIVLKGRSNRRQVSPLASSVLLPLEDEPSAGKDATTAPEPDVSDPPAPAPEAPAPRDETSSPPASREAMQALPEQREEPLPRPVAPAPVPAAPSAYPGQAPRPLDAPNGAADDLKQLKGIGPQNERKLNALGIFHIAQIAAWTPDEARWVGAALGFPGRVEREDWVGQAQAMMSGTRARPEDPPEVEAPLFPELDATAAPRPRRRR